MQFEQAPVCLRLFAANGPFPECADLIDERRRSGEWLRDRIDGSNFGSPVSLSGGAATSPATNSLSTATHAVTAVYSGDGGIAAQRTAPRSTSR